MLTRSALFVVAGAYVLASSCASGITPPALTEMVSITEGLVFTFGSTELCNDEATLSDDLFSCVDENQPFPDIHPTVQVELQPFAIDKHEVTNFQYEHCVALGGCSFPQSTNALTLDQQDYYENPVFRGYPVLGVTWDQALEYCQFVGKNLPSEFQWERVAKGNPDDGYQRAFPVEGLEALDDCRNLAPIMPVNYCADERSMQPADLDEASYTDYVVETGTGAGAEPERVLHLFGNAAEWVLEGYDSDITCLDPLPAGCKNCATCSSSDTQCQQDCKSCSSCLADGGTLDCFYACQDEPREFPVCQAYPASLQPVASEDLVGQDSQKIVRGGNADISANRTCHLRSAYRNRRLDRGSAQPWLGFRCARLLGTE